MAKQKIWKVSKDSNVFGISLTSNPANEEIGVYQDKEEKLLLQATDKKKHKVYCVVQQPDKLIYRDWDWYNEETDSWERGLYLQYDADVIESLAGKFLYNYNQRNISVEHTEYDRTFGYVCESWIKQDKTKDKSVALGLNQKLAVGTWIVGIQITDIETWEKIEDGELLPAASLEAWGVFEDEDVKQCVDEKTNIYKKTDDDMLKEELIKLLEVEDNQEIKQLKDEIERLNQVIEQSKVEAKSDDVQVVEQKEEEAKVDVVEENVELDAIKQELEESKRQASELQTQLEASVAELKQVKEDLEKISKKPSTEDVVEVKETKEESKPNRVANLFKNINLK
jgi:hypothetical protein